MIYNAIYTVLHEVGKSFERTKKIPSPLCVYKEMVNRPVTFCPSYSLSILLLKSLSCFYVHSSSLLPQIMLGEFPC